MLYSNVLMRLQDVVPSRIVRKVPGDGTALNVCSKGLAYESV